MTRYRFLSDTYETEILKTLSVWSMFRDSDLETRPHPKDRRGRSVREQMAHQCLSEDAWFKNMLGIDASANPLPASETRMEFIRLYARDGAARLMALREKNDGWWEESARFFGEARSRAWILTRRLLHSAHHRGQQTAMLRMLGRDLHSTYGPTADTGGLPANHADTIYAYTNLPALLEDGPKSRLPATSANPVTERPDPVSR